MSLKDTIMHELRLLLPQDLQSTNIEHEIQLLTTATNQALPTRPGKTRRTQYGIFYYFQRFCGRQQEYNYSTLVSTDQNKYMISRFTLGSGASGRVKLGIHVTNNNQPIAIKIFENINDAEFEQIIDNLKLAEFYINHINTENKKYIIMPFIPGNNLFSVLFTDEDEEYTKNDISLENQLDYAISMLEEVNKLHSKNLIVCDIKTENFMAYNSKAYITDLENVHPVGKDNVYKSLVTYGYIAPECFKNGFTHTQKTDIYALGATLMDVFSPHDREIKKTPQLKLADNAQKYYFNEPPKNPIEKKLWETCCEMISPKAEHRPTALEVLNKLNAIKQQIDENKKQVCKI